jgi:nicotinamide-nucleotide amidase
MTFHQDTFDRITAIFKKFNREILPQHMAQCDMPDNATILANDLGTAPGMLFEKGNKKLISMPGVPFEMKFIFKTHIVPLVKKSVAESFSIVHKTLMTYGQGETWLADMMGDLAINIPQGLSIAYLPSLGFVRIRVTGKGDVTIGQKVEEYAKLIYEKIGKHVYGYDDETPQEAILRLAKAQNLTLSTAESCTGGRLGHMITTVSGSSYYYLGGVVTYSNDLKMKLLGVKSETLKEYGAVSEQTVIEMADGSIKLTGSDIAVSISGIAGPDGGTPEKPVGTIWIGLAQKGHPTEAIKIQASKDRQRNIEYATNVAMAKILKRLLSI